MLQKLAAMVGVVVALFTLWAMSFGWSWTLIAQFDFWLFSMIFFSSVYLLTRWDEHKHAHDHTPKGPTHLAH